MRKISIASRIFWASAEVRVIVTCGASTPQILPPLNVPLTAEAIL